MKLTRNKNAYPSRRVICKTFTVPTVYLEVSNEKHFTGQLPDILVIGCVVNRALNGGVARNPLIFQTFSLSEISVNLDGQLHGIIPATRLWTQSVHYCAFQSVQRHWETIR